MSEYQYYELAALKRPLTPRKMAELRAVSTRATITAVSFINDSKQHWEEIEQHANHRTAAGYAQAMQALTDLAEAYTLKGDREASPRLFAPLVPTRCSA